jgi:hypothetical protein
MATFLILLPSRSSEAGCREDSKSVDIVASWSSAGDGPSRSMMDEVDQLFMNCSAGCDEDNATRINFCCMSLFTQPLAKRQSKAQDPELSISGMSSSPIHPKAISQGCMHNPAAEIPSLRPRASRGCPDVVSFTAPQDSAQISLKH